MAIGKFEDDTLVHTSTYKDKTKVIETILEKGSRFILMRRFRDELTTQWIESYFTNVYIEEVTDGEYNTIEVYRREIFYAFYDIETKKQKRGPKIGYAIALSEAC